MYPLGFFRKGDWFYFERVELINIFCKPFTNAFVVCIPDSGLCTPPVKKKCSHCVVALCNYLSKRIPV